jgi:hypothetical protein
VTSLKLVATVPPYIIATVQAGSPLLCLPELCAQCTYTLSVRWPRNFKKEGEDFDFILFYGLAIEGKSMLLVKFFCCLHVYLKLYLRLKLSRVNRHFFA